MNHGYCINCWWYKAIKCRHYIPTKDGLKEKFGNGKCFMHVSDDGNFSFVDGDNYCPDYYNRKRGNKEQKKTLDEWLNN